MPKVAVYNLLGKKAGELQLSEDVFGLKNNGGLLHQAYTTGAANRRNNLAHTKDRSEVAGSGAKPWRQKGTGNARVGSARNPIWRTGGVAFGPRNERNYAKKINRKMKKKAIVTALSGKVRDKELYVVDEIKLKEDKTREFAKAIEKLKIKGSILLSFDKDERKLNLYARNIPSITTILTSGLNVFDILNNKNLILSKNSIRQLEEKYKK